VYQHIAGKVEISVMGT